jgi:hypothetical protein
MRRLRQLLAGMASILDIQPAPAPRRRRLADRAGVDLKRLKAADADASALRGDWALIGKDLQHAIRREDRRRDGAAR